MSSLQRPRVKSCIERKKEETEIVNSEFNEKEHEYGKELSISFGHAFFKQGEDYKTVFQNADEAMYRNKEAFYSGKNDRRRSER